MATGKARSVKRSTGTSYSSTITTIIFIALCILGVWLLTSTSFSTPPQSTTRTANTDTTETDITSHHEDSKSSSINEDIPGEFPDDHTKPAEVNDNISDEHNESQEMQRGESQEMQRGNEIPKLDNDMNPEKLQGEESVEEQEKQRGLETQMSEESVVTQSQEIKQVKEVQRRQPVKEAISNEEKTQIESTSTEENHISDHDQQKRVEEHQKQEDAQIQQGKKEMKAKRDPHGALSDDQIQHDDATTNPVDDTPNFQEATDASSKKKQESSTSGESTGIPKESRESKKAWSTQADQSEDQKERRKSRTNNKDTTSTDYTWELCNVTAGADYIPCLDNEKAIAKLTSRKHYEHRERHCPEEPPTCLVPLPKGYKTSIEWPRSRDKIWYHNVPHTLLAEVKGHQNWVKMTGEFLTFPGGGTQFIHGALHYIDVIQEALPDIAWGKRSRLVLDVGCGVASFGGYLFERDVLTMSLAPKDEHEAQVQFALERGIPAISAVMGSQRLQYPSRVFDIVHCARCRVPWHADGGALLLELNRVLRPGGYFVWSATPVYQTLAEDVQIWKDMSALTVAMCWELVTIKKDKLNSVGFAIYHKPDSNDCYEQRKQNVPPMCKDDDDPNAAWYVPLQACMHKIPVEENERGSQWPDEWPKRVEVPPYWLNKSQMGIYGKPAPADFTSDYEHWKKVVSKTYMSGLGISWSNVRNIMDMRAVYGGFAAALKDLKVWVMNVVNVDSPDTLPIIYERGLFGIYHDWCESFSTYPRTYDLLHADHLFSKLKKRCTLVGVFAEVDRIARPGGKLIVRDESSTIKEVEDLLKSLHWEITYSKIQEGILSAQKSDWRP